MYCNRCDQAFLAQDSCQIDALWYKDKYCHCRCMLRERQSMQLLDIKQLLALCLPVKLHLCGKQCKITTETLPYFTMLLPIYCNSLHSVNCAELLSHFQKCDWELLKLALAFKTLQKVLKTNSGRLEEQAEVLHALWAKTHYAKFGSARRKSFQTGNALQTQSAIILQVNLHVWKTSYNCWEA